MLQNDSVVPVLSILALPSSCATLFMGDPFLARWLLHV